jgi:hypothetical protein
LFPFCFPFPKFGLKTFPKFGLKTKFWEKERETKGKGLPKKQVFLVDVVFETKFWEKEWDQNNFFWDISVNTEF